MAEYFVDNVLGWDGNDGRSEAKAWASMSRVSSAMSYLTAGDNVRFKNGGAWVGAPLIIICSGGQGLPILFSAYGTGPKPIIEYSDANYAAIYSMTPHLHDVKVQGIDCRNPAVGGMGIFFLADDVRRIYLDGISIPVCGGKPIFLMKIDTFEVTYCDITAGKDGGITVYGSTTYPACNGIISKNHVDGRGLATNDGIGIHEQDGTLADTGDHFLVSHNIVHGFGEQAIDINCGNYVTIEDNELYDNTDDGLIIVGFHQVIRRNRIYGNGRDGVILTSSTPNPGGDMEVSGNLVYDNGRCDVRAYGAVNGFKLFNNTILHKAGVGSELITMSGGPTNGIVKNNILIARDNAPSNFMVVPALTTNNIAFDRNCYWRPDGNPAGRFNANGTNYSFAGWQSSLGQDIHGLWADPKLNQDLTLADDSPCIGAGEDVGYGADIGAIQYQGGPMAKTINFTLNILAAPDFSVAILPLVTSIYPGQNAIFTISITPTGGFSRNVSLTLAGLPAGATGTFVPQSISPTQTSQLTIATTTAVALGNYNLTLTATEV